jgi:hypothetical protein
LDFVLIFICNSFGNNFQLNSLNTKQVATPIFIPPKSAPLLLLLLSWEKAFKRSCAPKRYSARARIKSDQGGFTQIQKRYSKTQKEI